MPVYRIKPDDRMVLAALHAANLMADEALVDAHRTAGGLVPHLRRVQDAIERLAEQGLVQVTQEKKHRNVTLTKTGRLTIGMSLVYSVIPSAPSAPRRYQAMQKFLQELPANDPEMDAILDEMDTVWYEMDEDSHRILNPDSDRPISCKCAMGTPHCPYTRAEKRKRTKRIMEH